MIRSQMYGGVEIELMNRNALNGFVAGIVGSALGISGGVILTADWIRLGLNTQETTSTSTFLVINTGIIAFVQVLLSDGYPIKELVVFILLSLVGSFAVSYLITKLINHYNKPSLVVVCLLAIIALSIFISLIKTLKALLTNT